MGGPRAHTPIDPAARRKVDDAEAEVEQQPNHAVGTADTESLMFLGRELGWRVPDVAAGNERRDGINAVTRADLAARVEAN
jgi:hypothetical protein